MSVTIERIAELRLALTKRRREVLSDVQSRVRDARMNGAGTRGHEVDHAVAAIDEALARLGEGKYGACVECAHEIAGSRLYALPFAVRCQPCEDRRERERLRQLAAERRSGASRFSGVIGA